MENRISTPILSIMNVLFWIVFIGLCIKTGIILISFLMSLFASTIVVQRMPQELNLSELSDLGMFNYLNIGLVLVISSGLKAYIAYLTVLISMSINLKQPFNAKICKWIERISHLALVIGIIQVCAKSYYARLVEEGFKLSKLSGYFSDGSQFLFLAGIIFIIAQIFKRGLELQSENELTI